VDWREVCRVEEVSPGVPRRVAADVPVALYNVDGEIYATEDTCTHGQSSLCDGYLDGDVIECAWHMAKFCVRTGKVLSLPAVRPLRSYPVQITDGKVFIADLGRG
jgi:nitrite reductase/ring-hydroxylating ferredoxin subunit